MKFSWLSILCLLPALMLLPARLHAQAGNADLQALRMQIEALKTEYQTRIESLEKQLEEVQTWAVIGEWNLPTDALGSFDQIA